MGAYDDALTLYGPPVHYWKFITTTPQIEPDSGSLNTPLDGSSGTFTAQAVGPILNDLTNNYAVEFTDGDLTRSTVLTAPDFGASGGTTGTLILWFKTSYILGTQYLFTTSAVSLGRIFVQLLAQGKITLTLSGNTSSFSQTTDSSYSITGFNNGAWVMLAIAFGSPGHNIYFNGVDFSTTIGTNTFGNAYPFIDAVNTEGAAISGLYFGRRSSGSNKVVGRIARVAFMPGKLSAASILAIYDSAFVDPINDSASVTSLTATATTSTPNVWTLVDDTQSSSWTTF